MMLKKVLVLTSLFVALIGCNVNQGTKAQELSQSTRIETEVVNKGQGIIVKGEEDLDKQTITILASADMHGRIYPYDYATDSVVERAGFGKIKTLVRAEREINPNLILMDVGDTVQGNSAELFNNLDTHPMVESMNSMDYDIWAIGNHEFNFEKEFIVRNINNFQGSVVSANIYNENDGSYFVNPYQLFDVNGAIVAVVGMLPPYVPMWEASNPSHFKGLEFEDVLSATQKVVESLEGRYDVLVGAYHIGRNDRYGGEGLYGIANAIPQFDIIFGGHEHALYVEEVNGVTILEPGAYGRALSKADITVEKIDGQWKVLDIKAENIDTQKVEADKELLEKMAFVHEQSIADANQIIGTITEDFIKGVDYITGEDRVTTMPRAQMENTAVIDLINEVQMYYANAEISSAALFTFASNLKAGDFKKKDVANIYRFTNTLMGVNITGENLMKFMEWSASYYNTWEEGDVTISFNPNIRGYNYDMFAGIDYEINLSKEAGNRIENARINGEEIDPNRVYKLAVNNYRFGTLSNLGLITDEDKYFDSYEEWQDGGRVRDLIARYTQEVKNGVLEPRTNDNWSITGVKLDYPEREMIYEKIKKGEIVIPRSADGRTLNIESINRRVIMN